MAHTIEPELESYRVAGEIYGRLRAGLNGGRLTMTRTADSIDYRWSFRKKRKEHTVNQTVNLHSLKADREVISLVEAMLSNLRTLAEEVS